MTIYKLDTMHILEALCKSSGKWGMLISFCTNHESDNPFEEIFKAAPYLNMEDVQMLVDNSGMILADTEEELYELYDQTVGDDGPTKTNPYDGEQRVYALTCGPDGQIHTENT